MRRRLERLALLAWRRRGAASLILRPLAWIYGALSRRHLQRAERHAWRAPVPVVVIGNILVGGTGKTPLAAAVCQALQQRGWHPGFISRGYGTKIGRRAHLSDQGQDSTWLGDEPALLHAETQAPVGVHPRRALAAQTLLERHPEIDLLIADDGLQHRELARDVEIIVQDQRGAGNGLLLPAGPLREPVSRLAQADWVVTHVDASSTLAQDVTAPPGTSRHVFMQLQAAEITHLASGRSLPWTQWLSEHGRTVVCALAGIGQPQRFFTMLRRAGLNLAHASAVGDHQAIDAGILRKLPDGPILITAKDAVKCTSDPDPRLWVVHVVARFSNPAWFAQLHRALQGIQIQRPHKSTVRH